MWWIIHVRLKPLILSGPQTSACWFQQYPYPRIVGDVPTIQLCVCVYIYVYKYMYYYYILMYMLSVATDPPRVPFSSPKEIPNKTSHDIPLIRSLQKVCHGRHQVLGHSHDTGELPVAQRRVKHGIYWGYMRIYIYICIYPSINLSIYLSFYLSMIYLCICICTYGVWDVTTVWYGFVWKWGIPKHVKPINFT